ncbi:MAG: GNAT family N-acetyltransferase [Halobacteriota archaeon]|nr:GNAT family N-acetyltransferase [Halobacteriota archaeon]
MKFTVREAEEKDADKIEELASRCSPLRGSVDGTYEYLAICFGRYFLLAESEGRIIAFLVSFPNLDVEGEIWIYQIGVSSESRRMNVAEELLSEEIKRFVTDGYKKVKARILEDNISSLSLFKKLGFNDVGIVDGWVEVEKVIS